MNDPETAPEQVTRRRLLGGAAVVGAGAALWFGSRLVARPDPLAFAEIGGLPPFRRLLKDAEVSIGANNTNSVVLIGLDAGGTRVDPETLSTVRAAPCATLFRGTEEGRAMPVAYFSDVRCPWCRIMEERLATLGVAQDPTIAFVEHELPVFGPASEAAARAILAAPSPRARRPCATGCAKRLDLPTLSTFAISPKGSG